MFGLDDVGAVEAARNSRSWEVMRQVVPCCTRAGQKSSGVQLECHCHRSTRKFRVVGGSVVCRQKHMLSCSG